VGWVGGGGGGGGGGSGGGGVHPIKSLGRLRGISFPKHKVEQLYGREYVMNL